MMGLDPRFIITSDLQEYFVDKDTGGPLAAGIVTFYEDINRTIKKPVYQISGTPPNYIYTVLPDPCTLSAVGTFQDALGNDIIPYYFPYEGTPDNSDGTVELYYITVESSDGVPQFTREGWPNFTTEDVPVDNEGFRNFIPNGQFLSHTQIVGSAQPPVLTVGSTKVQYIAQGGWTFKRSTTGTSSFNNTFVRISGAVSGLDDFPRYAFNFVCSSFNSSDSIRDLSIEWPDVNQFSSGNPEGSLPYTFFFGAKSNDSNSYTFDVRLIQNFGTGGSPSAPTDTSIGTITIVPSFAYYTQTIPSFPANAGTLGTNNDDYVAIALRGPNSSWTVQFTDFAMVSGSDVVIPFFPIQTEADMRARGVAGWMDTPNPDGSDLYLPLVLTPKGMQWDNSIVGKIYACAYTTGFTGSLADDTNEIMCDGSSYVTTDYSPLGIPYSRLATKLFDPNNGLPIYGSGFDFATMYYYGMITNELILTTNQLGAQSATANGTPSTTFSISTLNTGNNYSVFAYINQPNNVITVVVNGAGAVTNAATGTSGFTITNIFNSPLVNAIFTVQVGSLPSAGTYFTFESNTNYYVWFTINGSGADPAPGGTGILVPLISTYTTTEAAGLIRDAISGFQVSKILTVAAASIPAGSYFTFHAAGATYVPWYKVAGLGAAPAVGGTNIEIDLTGTETAAQVASKTGTIINTYKFAVPNLKGVFLRGMNIGVDNIFDDPDYSSRFTLNNVFDDALSGVGSYQINQLIQHLHTYTRASTPTVLGVDVGAGINSYVHSTDEGDFPTRSFPAINSTTQNSGYDGGAEVRPFNMYVNYVIKY